MNVQTETIEQDASAWTALVIVQGVLYVASFVADRLTVRLAPYKHPPRRARWYEKAVREWAEKRIALLPSAWMDAHRALYRDLIESRAA